LPGVRGYPDDAIEKIGRVRHDASMVLPDPSRLRLSYLARGVGAVIFLLAAANFVVWLVRDGLDAALDPDGGGGSTAGSSCCSAALQSCSG
jgi:hypothetical protein